MRIKEADVDEAAAKVERALGLVIADSNWDQLLKIAEQVLGANWPIVLDLKDAIENWDGDV